MRKMNNKTLIVTALMAAVLAGCGGGGGGDDKGAGNTGTPGNPGTPPVTENTTGPSLQNSVPAPTYAAGSDDLKAWNELQGARSTCGFGLLKQDVRLDAAARAHFKYILQNHDFTHFETQGKSGFTGISPQDRAKAQGFYGVASEALTSDGEPVDAIAGLLSAPYHARNLLSDYTEVGFGALREISSALFVIAPGKSGSGQKIGAGVAVNYPCEGAKNVSTGWDTEEPNPFPDLQGDKGTPILIRSDYGTTLTINNLAITRVLTGESLSYRTITQQNDINRRFSSNEYAAAPLNRLAVNEVYSVAYQGTVDGKPVGKTFTFKPTVMSGWKCKNPTTGEVYQCERN